MEFKIRGSVFRPAHRIMCLFHQKSAEKIIKYLSLIIFAIITLFLLINRVPFYDEANAWFISKSFSFFELFKIEKYDGHLFIWHTLLMPFSKNDFFYPYPMYILNWLFCMGALIVMWRFAPFSNILKTLITFSYPFVWYFSQVARCYSIGIFILFITLALWKERLKRPLIFSFLLILLANTSAMALIGAFVLGLIFIYDLLRSGNSLKNKVLSFLIMGFGAILVLIQLFGAGFPKTDRILWHEFFFRLVEFFFCFNYFENVSEIIYKLIAINVFAIYFFSLFYIYKKSKSALVFFIGVNILMILLFIYKYPGSWWHYLFFYIYFISALWIAENKKSQVNIQLKKVFNILLFALLILFNFQTMVFNLTASDIVYHSPVTKTVKIIKENNLFEGVKKIYTMESFSEYSIGIRPYFPEYKFIDIFGVERHGFEGLSNFSGRHYDKMDVDKIAATIDNNEKNIMIGYEKIDILEGKNWDIILTPVFRDYLLKLNVYEIYTKRKS